MELLLKLLVTILVGGCFGFLINKLKVPGGLLVGAIVGACIIKHLFWRCVYAKTNKAACTIYCRRFYRVFDGKKRRKTTS